MKIRCVDDLGSGYLTTGKTYDVVSESDGCYEIINDTGDFMFTRLPGALHGRFEVVEE